MSSFFGELLSVHNFAAHSHVYDIAGIPQVNRFVCQISAPSPSWYSTEYKTTTDALNSSLKFLVLSVDTPAFQLDVTSQELNGLNRYYVKGRTDGDLSITFLENPSLSIREHFYNWMNLAATFTTNGVSRSYLKEYAATDIKIGPLNSNGNAYIADCFIYPFPYQIQSIPYDRTNGTEIIKTTVLFKYVQHSLIYM